MKEVYFNDGAQLFDVFLQNNIKSELKNKRK